jgi:predicted anti-sigma-YlaC factor YlaD
LGQDIDLITKFLTRIRPTCQDATRLLSESMDRTLPRRTRIALVVHLLICRGCRAYRRQLQRIRGALAEAGDKSPLPADERLKQAFRDKHQ